MAVMDPDFIVCLITAYVDKIILVWGVRVRERVSCKCIGNVPRYQAVKHNERREHNTTVLQAAAILVTWREV